MKKEKNNIKELTVYVTGKCNLNCEWCSVKNRKKNDELSIQDIKEIIILYS